MKILLLALRLMVAVAAPAQSASTENVVIVTYDGRRWLEVFGGIDEAIITNKTFLNDAASLNKLSGAATPKEITAKQKPESLLFLPEIVALG